MDVGDYPPYDADPVTPVVGDSHQGTQVDEHVHLRHEPSVPPTVLPAVTPTTAIMPPPVQPHMDWSLGGERWGDGAGARARLGDGVPGEGQPTALSLQGGGGVERGRGGG